MSTTTASEPPAAARRPPARRLIALLGGALRQGLTPHQLALTLAVGVTLGVLPTLWGASLLCALAALLLRLNQPLVQLVNFLCYPLQLLLFLPYAHWGRQLFPGLGTPASWSALQAGFQEGFWSGLRLCLEANLGALGAWSLGALPLAGFCYSLGRVILRLCPLPSGRTTHGSTNLTGS